MNPVRFVLSLVLTLACASALAAQGLVARMNAGGPALTDGLGQVWSADQVYVPGSSNGYVGGGSLSLLSNLNGILLGGPDNPLRAVFTKSRVAWSAYRFEVPNGDYILRLTLAEVFDQGPGLRALNVSVEGAPFLVDVDLAARLGVQYGGQVATLVHVSDGRLDVEAAPGPGADPVVDGPLLSGIELWTAPPSSVAPPPVQELVAKASYGANLLSWTSESDPNLKGWRIWRADDPPGPPVASETARGTRWIPLADVWAAPTRFTDRTARVGRRERYRVAAVGLDGTLGPRAEVVSAIALPGAGTELPRYQVTLTAADQLFLDRNILLLPDDEVPATFSAGGTPRPAEARYRGNSARFMSKKSWKFKFSSAQAFEGRRALNLKASMLDGSLIREDLAHHLFESVGQRSFDVRPVHLEVNGSYLGVFNEAEQVDEQWLAVRDRETGGDLFKCDSNMTPLATLAMYQLLYEKETNESTGHDALIAFIEFLNAPPSATFVQDLANTFDLDSYLSYLAVVGWIADLDSVLHNFYLHQDLVLDRWELMPWDNDLTFALGPHQITTSILLGAGFVPGEPINRLRQRVLAEPALRWRYCEKIKEMEANAASPAQLAQQINTAAGARRQDAHADPYKQGWESDDVFENDVTKLLTYAALRTPIVDQEIALVEPAAPPTVVWINELAAESQTQLADDVGEFEDWVELHNAGASTLDVGGMYLSDDLGNATKWQIPGGTFIPAGGHLLVWCDNEAGDGPLHASFTLPAAGGELGLFAANGTTLLDFVCWNRQYPELSYGRTHDGGPFFRLLPTPTPGSANTSAGNLPPSLTWVTALPAVPSSIDPVAVTCHATDADGLSAVELHWRVNGGGYTTLAMTPLGADRYGATIPQQPNGSLVEYYFSATDLAARSSFKPAEGAANPSSYVVVDPALNNLKINEVMASNSSTVQDEAGDFEDWIEVQNTASVALDMGGMYLSDDLGNSTKWQIPAGTVIPAHGRLLFWADDEPGEGPLHATFKLSAGGEAVGLFDTLAFGNGLLDGYSFGAQTANVSLGHLPDGGSFNYLLSTPSPGASNLPANGATRVFDHAPTTANPLDITAHGPALIGGTLTVDLAGAPASSAGTLFVGLAPDDTNYLGLGFALVAPFSTVGFTSSPAGSASPGLAIPNDVSLIGVPLYAQISMSGGAFSNGVVATVGP